MKEMKWKDAQEEIKNGVTFLEFHTEWCGDCKMMEPIVENVENELKGLNIKFIKVNAEEANLFKNPDSKLEVLKVPSFFKVENGKFRHIGYEYMPLEVLTYLFK